MEFSEKLQQLRNQKEWTQEELGNRLFVSRTAVSKWESGRGYPSIDSLKAISKLFSVSIDDLLSGDELVSLAENEQKEKRNTMNGLVFGILDCMVSLLFFIPLFGQQSGDRVVAVPFHAYIDAKEYYYIWILYVIGFGSTALFGLLELTLQNWQNAVWLSLKNKVSVALSVCTLLLTMANRQPSAGALLLCFLIMKGVLLINKP